MAERPRFLELESPPLEVLTPQILDVLGDGIALIDCSVTAPGEDRQSHFRIRWANRAFANWCAGPVTGLEFYESLGATPPGNGAACPLKMALEKGITSTSGRLICPIPNQSPVDETTSPKSRQIDLEVMRLPGTEPLLVVQARDVTAAVNQQAKLASLHEAGRELTNLAPEQLAEMSVAERVDLLKRNIHRVIRDYLKVDLIEIRLLDPKTGLLTPLLLEGMGPEAASRPFRVALEGNGVTGYVAATGRSYLCTDTARDPLYVTGAPEARSSLTVALKYQDQIIGTLNLESPRANAFTQENLHDAELLSRDVADALHTLELLSAEKHSTATQSIEAVNREVALPVDDILANTTCILERYIGVDPDLADALRKILVGARQIKQIIQKVGEDLTPGSAPITTPFGQVVSSAPNAAIAQLRGLRVLVADNDDRVRRSAHSLLGRWGCTVETARDGREALTMARLESYDIILADIRLPDVNGYQIYQGLREAQPAARVILMTGFGYDPHHSLVKARQDGLRFILYKPFRVDQLLDALTSTQGEPVAETGKA